MKPPGGARIKGDPAFHDEVKTKRSLSLTPTCWSLLEAVAMKLHGEGKIHAASRSEAVEWLARNFNPKE